MKCLAEMHPVQRITLLSHLDKDTVLALLDALLVILKKEQMLTPTMRRRLNSLVDKHQSEFKRIANRSTDWKTARESLMRIGGFPLGFLLSMIVPAVLGQLLKK